jgi:hypothetical protein
VLRFYTVKGVKSAINIQYPISISNFLMKSQTHFTSALQLFCLSSKIDLATPGTAVSENHLSSGKSTGCVFSGTATTMETSALHQHHTTSLCIFRESQKTLLFL